MRYLGLFSEPQEESGKVYAHCDGLHTKDGIKCKSSTLMFTDGGLRSSNILTHFKNDEQPAAPKPKKPAAGGVGAAEAPPPVATVHSKSEMLIFVVQRERLAADEAKAELLMDIVAPLLKQSARFGSTKEYTASLRPLALEHWLLHVNFIKKFEKEPTCNLGPEADSAAGGALYHAAALIDQLGEPKAEGSDALDSRRSTLAARSRCPQQMPPQRGRNNAYFHQEEFKLVAENQSRQSLL